MATPAQSTRRLYWVQNADPNGDLGDLKGYLQDSWEEAVGVAGEILAGWDLGEADAVEVCELAIVRSQIFKKEVEEDEEDDDAD